LDREANHTDSRKVIEDWKDNLLFSLSVACNAVTLQSVDDDCAYYLKFKLK